MAKIKVIIKRPDERFGHVCNISNSLENLQKVRITKMGTFNVGEYIIYVNGDRYELGRIKRLTEDGAFICYHEGETAAKTPYDLMHKLVNGFTIKSTSIGGEVFKESEDKE